MVKEHNDALRSAGYDNIQLIGEGGSADVYKFPEADGTFKALKVFKKPYEHNWCERIKAECSILSRLDHEGVAKVYLPGVIEVREFLVLKMEYIYGVSLKEHAARVIFSEQEALDFLLKLSDGLSHVHSKEIIHRDIHAGNIILRDCQLTDPVIVDFSLARDYSLPELQRHEEYHTFRPIGAMSHCAPEKWLNPHTAGKASDIFSVGVMVFLLICGKRPYYGETYLNLYNKILSGQHPSVDVYRRDISEGFCELVNDMINPDLVRRVLSAERLKTRISDIIERGRH